MIDTIKIIHEPTEKEPFLIVYKPHNLPTAPLSDNDQNNLLAYCINLYPQIKNVNGRKTCEYGLVHRIDTVTDGLVLIAVTQMFYDYILTEQKKNNFIKYYRAECLEIKSDNTFPENNINICENKKIIVSSFFRYFGPGNKEVRPVLENSNKKILSKVGKLTLYQTEIVLKRENNSIKAFCCLSNGFKHQVRCHLAWIGFPIKNDPVYNKNNLLNDDINFTAYGLNFKNIDGKDIYITI